MRPPTCPWAGVCRAPHALPNSLHDELGRRGAAEKPFGEPRFGSVRALTRTVTMVDSKIRCAVYPHLGNM